MTSNPDDKRSLIIQADTEDGLLRGIGKIPGYTSMPLEEDLRRSMCLPAGEDRFYLKASSGERVIVRHSHGEHFAETINVLNQDAGDCPVPIHADEVVKLHHAIKHVEGLCSCVVAAEMDLLPPSE